nr:alginate export family protein [Algoriphagus sp. AGSA1]
MRFDEDYSVLESDTVSDWYSRLKYAKINKRSYVSFGGSFRVQYLIMDNEGWNPALRDRDGFMLTRWMVHADLHLSERLRIFAEVQSALANSREILVPVEENPLKAHQLFIDYKPFNHVPLTLRAGRQELSYGSERLISVRDAPNSRRSFDGIKAFIRQQKVDTDVFYMHAVEDKIGIFDDSSSPDLKLWGAFSDISTAKKNLKLNFYYLGFYNSKALFNDGGGVETRHTLAARIVKKGVRWGYDLEGGYQFGSIGDRKIAAWSTAFASSYRFNGMLYYPEIGLKADIISGDKSSTDQKHQTLNPLFAPGAYFGMAAPLGPSNLIDVHPSMRLKLGNSTSFACDYSFLWRYSIGDGIYRPNMIPYFEFENTSTRYIGSQISGVFIFQPTRHISLATGMSWFNSGGYLKKVTVGDDILFGFATAQVKF